MIRAHALGLAALALTLACGDDSTQPPGGAPPDGQAVDSSLDGGDAGVDSGDSGSPAATASVLQFHKNASRDGVYLDPLMTTSHAGAIHRDATFAATLTGQ